MHTFSSSYGRVLSSEPLGIRIPTSRANAAEFAIRADREADAALAQGLFDLADRLAVAAIEARCRALGGRA